MKRIIGLLIVLMTCSALFSQENQDAPMGTFLYFSSWGLDGDLTINENVAQVMTFAESKIDFDKPAPFGDTHSDDILVELPMPEESPE